MDMNKKSIGIIVGSLRSGSYSKKVAFYVTSLLEEKFSVKILDIGNLVIYNEDLDKDSDAPQEWLGFRQEVKALDAVLFITPEYNRSIPAVLKNALDVASRPKTDNAWNHKPGAVISISPGAIGGFGANHHLRQTAACLNIFMMEQPEAYVGGIAGAFDENDVLNESVQGFLHIFIDSFADWINIF